MKTAAPPIAAPAIPVIAGEPVAVQQHKIPLAAKVAGSAFLAVLVPVYWHTYGPTNFLWFCDAALLLTVAGNLDSRPKIARRWAVEGRGQAIRGWVALLDLTARSMGR